MGFVADALFDCRCLRAPPVVDIYTRECPAIDVGSSLRGEDVVSALARIVAARGKPRAIKTDNGSKIISKAMDRWAYGNGVELDFSRPAKPIDSAKVESFNRHFRAECLNSRWFLSLTDAQRKIESWPQYDNEARPGSALARSAPAEYDCLTRLSAKSAAAPESEIAIPGWYGNGGSLSQITCPEIDGPKNRPRSQTFDNALVREIKSRKRQP